MKINAQTTIAMVIAEFHKNYSLILGEITCKMPINLHIWVKRQQIIIY